MSDNSQWGARIVPFKELLENRDSLKDGVIYAFPAETLSPEGYAAFLQRFEAGWAGIIRPLGTLKHHRAIARINKKYDHYFSGCHNHLQNQKRYFYAEKYFQIEHPRGVVTVMLRARGALVFQELRFDNRMAQGNLTAKTCPKEYRVRVYPVWSLMFDSA